MKSVALSEEDDHFWESVGLSAVAHVLIIAVFTIKAYFGPSESLILNDAIRVDIVALPDKIQPAPPQEAATPPAPKVEPTTPKAVEKPAIKIDSKKIKSEQKKAIEQLKAMEAIDSINKEVSEKSKPKPVVAKGNALSKGNSLTGLARLEYNEYLSLLQKHVKERWDLPQFLADANLKAQVLVLIDEQGVVIRKDIIASSGNNIFDNTVLAAVERASPVPLPPEKLQGVLRHQGAIFNFP